MISAAKLHAPHLDNAEALAFGAVFKRELLQRDDTVCDAVQLQIVITRRKVVEQHHRAAPPREKVLKSKNLPPIAQRVLRQQAHLGQRVEDHTLRADRYYAVENALSGF